MDANPFLKHLGIIKNELLIFTVMAVIITNSFGRSLVGSADRFSTYCGYAMHLSTIPMIFGFGMFYAYALWRLPSSTQELQFEISTKKALESHAGALAPPKRRARSPKTP